MRQIPVKSLIALSSLLLLTSCATSLDRQIPKVKMGMEKSQVLEILGSPDRTSRWNSRDEWRYIYYVLGKRQGADVHFEQGEVVYVGKAKLRPDLKDRLENAQSFEEYKDWVEERKKEANDFRELE